MTSLSGNVSDDQAENISNRDPEYLRTFPFKGGNLPWIYFLLNMQ